MGGSHAEQQLPDKEPARAGGLGGAKQQPARDRPALVLAVGFGTRPALTG
jgi:hypothetical protein